ncbi:hypothetical protein, partial [Agrobacterium sp. ST15.13.015]|uniref:hypothetical protein n=1 Tax=Agrobacterium sp. ST15.13.015 TaxID=3017319 RepID=UPI0022EC30EA
NPRYRRNHAKASDNAQRHHQRQQTMAKRLTSKTVAHPAAADFSPKGEKKQEASARFTTEVLA